MVFSSGSSQPSSSTPSGAAVTGGAGGAQLAGGGSAGRGRRHLDCLALVRLLGGVRVLRRDLRRLRLGRGDHQIGEVSLQRAQLGRDARHLAREGAELGDHRRGVGGLPLRNAGARLAGGNLEAEVFRELVVVALDPAQDEVEPAGERLLERVVLGPRVALGDQLQGGDPREDPGDAEVDRDLEREHDREAHDDGGATHGRLPSRVR